MAFTDTTTYDAALQELYVPRLRRQFHTATPLASRIENNTDDIDFAGRRAVIAAHSSRNEGFGARVENVALPSAQYQRTTNLYVSMAYNYGSIKLTRQVMVASSKSKGAFASAMRTEMTGIREGMIYDIARQMVNGSGTGVLTQANGAGAATTTLTVDSTQHLRKGMIIDIWTATSGGTQEVNSIEISSITSSTVAVLASAQTWSNDSYVYREDVPDAEVQGLRGVVDDSTVLASFQGVNRSTAGNEWWKANRLGNSGTNRALTRRLVDDGVLEAEKNGGGGVPTAIYSKHAIAQTYADLWSADRRYSAKDMTADLGYAAVEYTTTGGPLTWISDRMCQANQVFFVNEKDLVWFDMLELDWLKDDSGAILCRALDGTDALEARLGKFGQLGATRCSGQTIVADVSES